MSARNPVAWLRWTRIAAGGFCAILFVLCVIASTFWQYGRAVTLFQVPLAELAFVVLMPFAIAFSVWRMWRFQDRIDRHFSVWEE